jgi:hypothetical protein
VITLIIPFGVFMRYAMNKPIGWPEPTARDPDDRVLVRRRGRGYRANVHIAVEALANACRPPVRTALRRAVTTVHDRHGRFMLGYGADLCWIVRTFHHGGVPRRLAGASSTCRYRSPAC